jgi:hypothetical protein
LPNRFGILVVFLATACSDWLLKIRYTLKDQLQVLSSKLQNLEEAYVSRLTSLSLFSRERSEPLYALFSIVFVLPAKRTATKGNWLLKSRCTLKDQL